MPDKIVTPKIQALKNIGSLILSLIIGLLIIILLMSLIFNLKPLNFFKEVHKNIVVNITYIVFLYFMLFFVVGYRAKKDNFGGIFGLGLSFKKFKWKNLLFIAIITALFMGTYFYILVLAGVAQFKPFIPKTFIIGFQGLIFGFLVALVEEILFRGIFLQNLLKGFSIPFSFLATNAFFASLHILRPGNFSFKTTYFIGLMILGIVLSYIWYIKDSLWPSIIFHTILITGMYLYGNILTFFPKKYNNLAIIWGLDQTPIAGIFAIIMIIVLLGIIKSIKTDEI